MKELERSLQGRHRSVGALELGELIALLRGRRLAVLAGAGCSTESGIPDYRGPTSPVRRRRPMQYREFIEREDLRQRYWARALVGWKSFAGARPNPAHFALAELERAGLCVGLITQNVDGLHHAAGSTNVLELHGSLHRVFCLLCKSRFPREHIQSRLLEANPTFGDERAAAIADGDADLDDASVAGFRLVACERCGGPLKPDVVFFGENVPKKRVQRASESVDRADALLVVGSSLTVFSGFRFVRQAASTGRPVAIVNLGPTRGDSLASLCLDGRVGLVLPVLTRSLVSVGARTLRGRSL